VSRERNLDPNASPLAFLGAELRRCRKRAGLSQPQLSELTSYSTSMISKIERAQRPASRDFAYECDRVFDLDGHFARLYQFTLRASGPSWFMRWLEEIEPKARVLRNWEPLLVPGLLQTEAYARHIFTREPGITAQEIEDRLQTRMLRKGILQRADPPALWILMDEGVLHRPIGGWEVMRDQMEQLLEAASRPNVTIQIVPYLAGSAAGLSGAFILAELPAGQPNAAYVELPAGGEVTVDHDYVDSLWTRYEAIRSDAQPQYVSLQLIKDAAKRWTREEPHK
jgi:transcriptional regulator with XRE-family HTH domain